MPRGELLVSGGGDGRLDVILCPPGHAFNTTDRPLEVYVRVCVLCTGCVKRLVQ